MITTINWKNIAANGRKSETVYERMRWVSNFRGQLMHLERPTRLIPLLLIEEGLYFRGRQNGTMSTG